MVIFSPSQDSRRSDKNKGERDNTGNHRADLARLASALLHNHPLVNNPVFRHSCLYPTSIPLSTPSDMNINMSGSSSSSSTANGGPSTKPKRFKLDPMSLLLPHERKMYSQAKPTTNQHSASASIGKAFDTGVTSQPTGASRLHLMTYRQQLHLLMFSIPSIYKSESQDTSITSSISTIYTTDMGDFITVR